MATPRKRIGELLVEARAIDQMQLHAALGHQRQWGGRLGQVLVQRGFLTEQALLDALGTQLRVPVVELARTRIDQRAVQLVPAALAEQLHLFPLEIKGSDKNEQLVVAMSDPTDLAAMDQLQFRTRKRIQPVLAGDKDIERAIRRHYYDDDVAEPAAVSHKPMPQQPPAAPARRPLDPFDDSDLLGGEDDMVPGLVAWGEGEVARPPAPARNQPTPAPQQAAYAQPTPRPAVMPAGVPPGFGSTDPRSAVRGRTLAAPQGQRAPPPAVPVMADLDPFAELEPELPDPLRGTDPHDDYVSRPPAPEALDFDELADPLAGTSPDAWKADLEPIAAHLDDPSSPPARLDAAPLEELDALEELDVDVLDTGAPMEAMLETPSEAVAVQSEEWAHEEGVALNEGWAAEAPALSAEALDPEVPAELPAEIDAAAEGWLTPAEDAGEHALAAHDEAAWDAPLEADAMGWDAPAEAPAAEPIEDAFEANSSDFVPADGVHDGPLDPALDSSLGGAEPVTEWGAVEEPEAAWDAPAEDPSAEPALLEAAAPVEEAASEWLEEGWQDASAEPAAAPEEQPLEGWDAAPAPSVEGVLAEEQPVEIAAEEWSAEATEVAESEPILDEEQPVEVVAEEWSAELDAAPLDAASDEPQLAVEPEHAPVDDAPPAVEEDALAAWAGVDEEPAITEAPAPEAESAYSAEPAEAPVDDALSAWAGLEEPASVPPAADGNEAAAWAAAEEPAIEEPAIEEPPAAAQPSEDDWAGFGADPAEEAPVEAAAEEPAIEEPAHELTDDAVTYEAAAEPAIEEPAHELTDDAIAYDEIADEPAPQLEAAPLAEHSAPEDTTRTGAPAVFGWQWIGIDNPTSADAVRVVGCLIEVLVQRAMIDPQELANAVREAEELSRS